MKCVKCLIIARDTSNASCVVEEAEYVLKGSSLCTRHIPPESHQDIHKQLHDSLDQLLAEFIVHTKQLPSDMSLMEFIEWSYQQTINPTEIV